jgi:hypothetical protein
MVFLFVDVHHLAAYFASSDVATAVGLMKIDLEGGKLLLTVVADLELILFFHQPK